MACNCRDDFRTSLDAGLGTVLDYRTDGTVAVDIAAKDTSTIRHTVSGQCLQSDVKIDASICDQILVDTGSGLSAGPAMRANIGSSLATRDDPFPQPVLVIEPKNGQPVIAESDLALKSMYMDNPSDCRVARVLWMHHHTMPFILASSDFRMNVDVQERLFGTGNPAVDGMWNTVDRVFYRNDFDAGFANFMAMPSVTYTASGTILPGAEFQVDSRLVISNVVGGAFYRDELRGRGDAFLVTDFAA